MKKILIAVDPFHLNQSTLAFGCYLARLTKSRITGVFLENLEADREAVVSSNTYEGTLIEYKVNKDSPAYREKMKHVDEKIQYFKTYFENHGIITSIHEDKGIPIDEIIKETRFADLLVIDAEAGFSTNNSEVPGPLAKRMMAESECPVLIAPLTFEGIDEIVFSYNGGKSCMFAIKQFVALFSELQDLKITVVEVCETGDEPALYVLNFKEWMEARFTNIHYLLLSGPKDTELLNNLIERRKSLLIMGAYGRSAVSNFFRHSTADLVLKISSQPIFISHQ